MKNDLPFDGLLSIISTRLGTESIIFEDIELSAAAIDSDGKVTQTTEERITIDLDRPQIERLLLNEEVILKIDLATQMNGNLPASIFIDNGIEVGLSARINLKIQE